MSENSRISWTTHTFNPWTGCTQVSPACNNCYALAWSKRSGVVEWGPGKPRRRTTPAYWRQPYKWEREAITCGIRPRVFCASLADVFDAEVEPAWRADLWELILATPHLDWLLLTKRPNLIRRNLPADWGTGWPNVWLGTTVESQAYTWRIRHLVEVPAVVRFLSCEPLLGPLDLAWWIRWAGCTCDGEYAPCEVCYELGPRETLDWIIAGGESGAHRRPMDWAWARSLRDQCQAEGVAFWWKQGPSLRPGQDALLDDVEYHELPTPRVVVPS
jgi:protein gp37